MEIKQNPEAIYTELEGKIIILEAEKGEILTFNETASFIWRKSKRTIEVKKLIDELCREFKVEKKVAAKDVQGLVKSLIRRGLFLKA